METYQKCNGAKKIKNMEAFSIETYRYV